MMAVSKRTISTLVKVLCAILIASPQAAFSEEAFNPAKKLQEKQMEMAISGGATTNGQTPLSPEDAKRIQNNLDSILDKTRCDSKYEKAIEAKKEFRKTCGEAGLSGNCESAVTRCEARASDEEWSEVDMFLQTVGLPTTSSVTSKTASDSSACPHLTGEDYYERQKDLQDEMTQAKEDLAELKIESADMEKDYNTEINDLLDQNRKNQKNLKDLQRELKDTKREKEREILENQQKTAEAIRSKQKARFEAKNKLSSVEREYQDQMIKLSQANAKDTCHSEVLKRKAELAELNKKIGVGAVSGSFSAMSNRAKSLRSQLELKFANCMSEFNQRRLALIDAKRQRVDTLQQELTSIDTEIEELEASQNQVATQLAEMKADLEAQEKEELQRVNEMATQIQQKMQQAQTNLKQRQQALADREKALQEKFQNASQKLAKLGPEPKSSKGTKTVDDARAELEDLAGAISDYCTSCSSVGAANTAICLDQQKAIDGDSGSRRQRSSPSTNRKGSI